MASKKILNLLRWIYEKMPDASTECQNFEILDFKWYGFSIKPGEVQEWLEEYQKNIEILDFTEGEFIIKKVNNLLCFYKEIAAGLQKNGLSIGNFQHLDNFVEWLESYSNCEVDADYAVLSIVELVKKYESSGFAVFELSRCERAKQCDFMFSYHVAPAKFDGDGELVKDEVFIF